MSPLNDEFDCMINKMKYNGTIKDNDAVEKENNNLVNIIGNIVGEVDVVESKNRNGKTLK